mgnify:CR=1 FL=1
MVEALQFPVFEDKALFTQKMAPAFGDQNKMSNPSGVPLPITYSFTVHGVSGIAVSYTHLRAHETRGNLVCRLQL